jgi:hypothetical protein
MGEQLCELDQVFECPADSVSSQQYGHPISFTQSNDGPIQFRAEVMQRSGYGAKRDLRDTNGIRRITIRPVSDFSIQK